MRSTGGKWEKETIKKDSYEAIEDTIKQVISEVIEMKKGNKKGG